MLPSLPFNVLFFFPGYIRLKIDSIKHNQAYGKKVEDILMKVPGVLKAEANPTTGSLLLRYAPKSIDVDALISAGKENGFVPENHSWDIEYIKKILTKGLFK